MNHGNSLEDNSHGYDYDYVIIGSGFGGSVSALRLAEKGYKVLVIEKGKWWRSEDFPANNWNLRKWMWEPRLGLKGFFKMTFLRHVTVLSGVGVGGGSLVYANTLPVPERAFYHSGSWKDLVDWESELSPFYEEAYRMLGAAINPVYGPADKALEKVAKEMGKLNMFHPVRAGVYFGEPGKTVDDPYFKGKGPERTGCIHCGECMTGCRHGAKNSLDKNYLYLAMQQGAVILAENTVTDVVPLDGGDGSTGYSVTCKSGESKDVKTFKTRGVVFAGGVLGTVPLLLKLKDRSLPGLSDLVGYHVSTNNEALIYIPSREENVDYTRGLAIGSILHTDENSHLEPVRYGRGSGFFKVMLWPMAHGSNFLVRMLRALWIILRSPVSFFRILFSQRFSERSSILLFMQTLNSTIRLKKGFLIPFNTVREEGAAPSAFIPEAKELAMRYSKIVNGVPMVSFAETLLGNPTTAHILGGCVMGKDRASGVIDADNRVYGYRNMLVCDGSMISSNPGVNPSLSITAITERAMSRIPEKK